MVAAFVPNQNVDDTIAVESPGHVFATKMEPWLGQSGALDWLWIFSLSPGQANSWITGKGIEEMIYFSCIRPDKLQGLGKTIFPNTTAALRRNQSYWRLNNIKSVVHCCRSLHTMGLDLD